MVFRSFQVQLFLLCSILLLSLPVYSVQQYSLEDWQTKYSDEQVKKLSVYPKGFLWGTATSAAQVESDGGNSTYSSGSPFMKRLKLASPDLGCRHDEPEFYTKDFDLMKNELGVDAYRCSIAWDKIQLQQDAWDAQEIERYRTMFRAARERGIKLLVTLHHYAEPLWFAELGGFAQERNIIYFVNFAKRMFQEFQSDVHMWVTFNSPNSYAVNGYYNDGPGCRPPGVKNGNLAVLVYKNMLLAHALAYDAMKAIDSYGTSCIGVMVNIFQLRPSRWYNPLERLVCKIADDFQHTPFFTFFTQGIFKVWMPGYINYSNKKVIGKLDFVAVNNYARGVVDNTQVLPEPSYDGDERNRGTQSELYNYNGKALYEAIKRVHSAIAKPLNIPIYITENGIGTESNVQRKHFFQEYMAGLTQAITDGCNVRGYFCWSFMDNWEWHHGYTKHFGLYSVNRTTFKRTLKEDGVREWIDYVAQQRAASGD